MRLYWEIGKRAFQRQLAYRTANLAGLVTNSFFGYVRAAIFVAAFGQQGDIAGYTQAAAITYTWVTQSLIMLVMLWGWWELEKTIKSGDVISDLSKPFSFLGFWLARDVGRAAYHLLFRAAPILLVGQLVFGLRWPASPAVWPLFGLSCVFALLISFGWRFLVNLSAFWLADARGIGQVAFTVVYFLSGLVIPLRLLPDWLAAIALSLPFAGILQTPTDVFLERVTGPNLLPLLGLQAFWAAALLCAAQLVLTAATRRLVIQGG